MAKTLAVRCLYPFQDSLIFCFVRIMRKFTHTPRPFRPISIEID